jgi:copper chaperone CopZ
MSVTQNIQLRIGGMTCAHCPPAIEKALAAVTGVTAAQVNPATKIAKIEYDPSRTKITSILQAIRAVGYTVGTATARIPIKNMHCSSCIIRVELALQMTPGIVSARASGGYHEAMILVKGGYTPDTIIVRSGRPVRLNFSREETASCSDKVIFADFQKSADLPTGQTVAIELLPKKPGEFGFACPMGMFRGRLIVE